MDVDESSKNESMLDLSCQGIDTFSTFNSSVRMDPNMLTDLDLSGNRVKRISDDEIGHFPNLITLNLSSNQLVYLPSGLCGLAKLKTLIIRNNFLCELPKCMNLSLSLETLNVSGNKLENFPVQVLQLSRLKQLHLGGNHIQNVPKEIAHMTRYNYFNLIVLKLKSTKVHFYQQRLALVKEFLGFHKKCQTYECGN